MPRREANAAQWDESVKAPITSVNCGKADALVKVVFDKLFERFVKRVKRLESLAKLSQCDS